MTQQYPHDLRPNRASGSDFDWLPGGGEMGDLIRTIDWSQTSLGPARLWPQSLKTTISICLSSTFPTSIVWGREMVQIYNDSYRPICGDAHPKSMGAKFWDTWESARPAVGEIIERASQAQGSYLENLRMFLERKGYVEEAFMTFSFSPISNESGEVGGLFHPITETTERMLHTRRTQILRDLAIKLSEAKNLSEIFELKGETFEPFELDLPYLAFFEWQADAIVARSHHGITSEDTSLLLTLAREETLSPALRLHASQTEILEFSFDQWQPRALKIGPYPEVPRTSLIIPLVLPGSSKPLGFMLAGVSARRAMDEAYRSFYENLGQALNKAIANVYAFEQEQKRALALAEIDQVKTHFFSNVSHELRTPLTLMLGPLEDQLTKPHLAEDDRQALELIYRNGKRLRKLVNSLLDFSRIEAGRLKASFALTDVPELTRGLAGTFRSTIEKAGLEFRVSPYQSSELIYIDTELWERILLNLLSNAYKYTLAGFVEISFEETEGELSVLIRDSGIGIPKADQLKLFERFHRVEGAKGRSYEGTGIGLSLVKQLVNIQGATIDFESEEGKGSCFRIRLKKGLAHFESKQIVAPDETRIPGSNAALFLEEIESWARNPVSAIQDGPARSASSSLGVSELKVNEKFEAATVLVVDDNADMRAYVASFLSKNYQVLQADNGLLALDIVRNRSVDLVLSDVMMPGLSGFELLKEIRSDETISDLPVILLSARAGEEAKIEGLREGANDYLVKPFSSRELIARVGSTLQISKMKIETALLRSNRDERLRSTFAHAAVGMLLLDTQGIIIDANRSFSGIIGYSIEELRGMNVAVLNQPDTLALSHGKMSEMMSETITGFVIEKQLVQKDGSLCWVQNSISAARDESGAIDSIIVVCEDIQARKESEDLARKALLEAETANHSKSLFLANMSHEIRTPLGVINGYLDLLSHTKILPAEQESWLEIMARNAQQLAVIIDDVLDLSRVEADKIELAPSSFELSELIRDVKTTFAHKAEEKGLIMSYDVEAAEGRWLFTDRNRLRQILVNVIGNAIKFTERGGVELSYQLDSVSAHVESHTFQVKDSGIGMSESERSKIFQPFSQADSSINRKFGGTGLGLALSRNLARMMGGELSIVESRPREGSTFALTLNLESQPELLAPPLTHDAEALATDSLSRLKVLLVEDSPDNQLLLNRILKKVGISEIDLAVDGQQGVEMGLAGIYDLILMDVQMPRMDGFEAVRRLRKEGYRKPIIALTAHAMKGYRDECLKAGFDDYLMKPINRQELIKVMDFYSRGKPD